MALELANKEKLYTHKEIMERFGITVDGLSFRRGKIPKEYLVSMYVCNLNDLRKLGAEIMRLEDRIAELERYLQ